MKIQPFGDRVVVRVLLPEEEIEGGLLLAPVSKDNSNRGIIEAIGEDVKLMQVGDVVIFSLGCGLNYSADGEDYKVLNVRDVLGKVIND